MAVYLDFNATTPVDSEVQAEICSVLKNTWGNPSSSYPLGVEAKLVVGSSRIAVADMINARHTEILFTSGGTESNNMVLLTMIKHYEDKLKNDDNMNGEPIPHIITTNIEHDAIRIPLQVLAKEGKINVTFVPVSKLTGMVDVDDVINEIRLNTILITIMLANNETGMIQPVSLIKKHLECYCNQYKRKIYLHTDAAQAIGKIDVDVLDLGVDYLTIVGHKFYAPRIGALYVRESCPLFPIFYGGGQENGLRPGTENTCMIAGLGKAAWLVSNYMKKYEMHMTNMRIYLEQSLKKEFLDKAVLNFKSHDMKLPNTVSVAFNYDNITGKMLLNEAPGIYASTGAACHSGGQPSAVLIASGVSETLASKTLRLSVGRETTKKDIDLAIKHLKDALLKLEKDT